ncbi:MAG: 5-formyltetrahydrofolate cyclo-ligase, partial [Clostridiaceae bacterium]|nr:5-formyltetrahydrofolate cyclo-ligase [Clostridiaceae bacterium]
EPDKKLTTRINPDIIDFVIVPGVVFDIKRNRIGYGAGFYDAFLKRLDPRCFKAGIAFEFQVYQQVPVEPHDVPLDTVITEERFI